MVDGLLNQSAAREVSLLKQQYIRAYRLMLLARILDDKLAVLYRAGKIHGGVFLGRGQEALSAATGLALRKGDVFAPLIRDTAGRLAFGETVLDAVRTYLGSARGPMRGRDGNVHRGTPQTGMLAMISHLGAMISVVNGVLLARRLKKQEGSVGAACIGDGATSTGSFHEAVNQAAIERLPLVLVVANNQYAYSTPNSQQFACESLQDKAIGYGVEPVCVDGTDLADCLQVLGRAIERARGGAGPQMVFANFLRLCGHGEHDDAGYIPPQLKACAMGKDCLAVAESELAGQEWAEPHEIDAWRAEATQEVVAAVATAQREAAPDPYTEDWSALSCKWLSEGVAP